MRIILYITLSLFFVACGSKTPCKLEKIETIYYTSNKGKYLHNIYIENFEKKCIDSLQFIKISRKYIDTIRVGKPIDILKFYSSKKDFIEGETSQVWSEVNKSCLLSISFDKTSNPVDFVFYNDNGQIIYWGNRWYPNGEPQKL